jgi:hypothetical protein
MAKSRRAAPQVDKLCAGARRQSEQDRFGLDYLASIDT